MNLINLFKKKNLNKSQKDLSKEEELLEKLGASPEEVEKVSSTDGSSIIKDGRINLQEFKLHSSTSLGYVRKQNYAHKTGYTGCDCLFIINGELNESIETISLNDNLLTIVVPIMSCCDNDYEMLNSLKDATITQLFVNEYDEYVVRDINGVTFFSESFSHSIDNVSLNNLYKYEIKSVSSIKTLSDAEFIERFDKIIKKTDNGSYKAKK